MDVSTIAAVLVTAVLAFEGVQKRKLEKARAALASQAVVCPVVAHEVPGMVEELGRKIVALTDALDREGENISRVVAIVEQTDDDDAPRVYGRATGRKIINRLSEIRDTVEGIKTELEIQRRSGRAGQ